MGFLIAAVVLLPVLVLFDCVKKNK